MVEGREDILRIHDETSHSGETRGSEDKSNQANQELEREMPMARFGPNAFS
jgi:hypothetical protein